MLNNKKISFKFKSNKLYISDGATGTNLLSRGLPKGTAPEVWVLENPSAIVQLHKDFIAAGAEIILTCTFGGSSIRLDHSNLGERTEEINKKAVGLARTAIEGSSVMIAGSMGPLGQMLQPLGTLAVSDAKDIYAQQAKALVEAGVNFLLIETQFDLNEAKAAIQGIQSVSSLPIVCSFSYDRGTRTMMGVSPKNMAGELSSFDLMAIGINCGKSIEDNFQAMQELNQSTKLPIWFKPNAGLPEMDKNGNPTYSITPQKMGAQVKNWINAGANIIGGCCGTTPEHLQQIAINVRNYQ
ncbi:MAG TPA: homocysteine S-methyltransferase family protein [Anaerolineae bacterium]|nr:homocysteine S-methyltransferase family protein [Anaerolineae bacterium]